MKTSPLRLQYFRKLIGLLLTSYIIFFAILCLVEFRKAIFDPNEFAEALHEVSVFFWVGIASLPIAVTIAWRLTQRLLLPLSEMAQTADQISGGQFERRIRLNETYDELDRMAASLNLAFDRYESTLAQMRSFSGDAAHQLRTPLTAIRSTGEIALLKERSPEEYAQVIGHMLEELQSLTYTVDQLLQLARLEAGTLRASFVSCCGADAIWTPVDRLMPLAECRHISIETTLDESSRWAGNPELIEQAISNVIDNAIRHTPDGGQIQITQQGACVRIEDSGPGIDAALLPHIFEQFRTGGQAGQTGLGLAIAQKIVELHGGSILAENGADGGACFELTFKLVNEIGVRPIS